MKNDNTHHSLKHFLDQISPMFTFSSAVVDMRKMYRLLNYDRSQLNSILSPAELERLEQFVMPKKKIQWLAGRYAVKSGLLKLKPAQLKYTGLNRIEVLNQESSAPYLVQFPELQISITHSYPYCIGVVSEDPIGVDLEKIIPLRESLINQFFHPNEIQNLAEIKDAEKYQAQAILYWTRKEAVSKLLKLGLKMNFKQLDTAKDSLLDNDNFASRIRLESANLSGYCCSIAISRQAF